MIDLVSGFFLLELPAFYKPPSSMQYLLHKMSFYYRLLLSSLMFLLICEYANFLLPELFLSSLNKAVW